MSVRFLPGVIVGLVVYAQAALAQVPRDLSTYVRQNYVKQAHKIQTRDGVQLYTIVYSPKDKSQKYPILMTRTPYGVAPYEDDKFRDSLGPNPEFPDEKYIFVYQDVRGRFMSEGVFENMRPQLAKRISAKDVDESTDTYDSIDWLVKNVPNNNGRVGMWGISYPGFYTAAGMIGAHPNLKAASPQAPIADWYFDDFFHHGAFFLGHAFGFFSRFGHPRPEPTTKGSENFQFGTPDGYDFFLRTGSIKNVDAKHFKGKIAYWNTMAEHPNYDDFWKARNLLPHLHKVAPAVMTVGGWFDAEDLYGPLKIYRAVEKNNPDVFNVLVMGPWSHGGWSRTESSLGNISFGANHSAFFQKHIELPFFNHFLKDKGQHGLPEAYVYETGVDTWRKFPTWPPADVQQEKLYLSAGRKLTFEPPSETKSAHDSFLSDPRRPVPFTEAIATGMTQQYMTDDQRFASRRPDVLVYQTEPLQEAVTLAGPLRADLHVATTGTDADWVVKVIDVFPSEAKAPDNFKSERPWGGYQMMVRSEVIRGRFRKSYSEPEPFVPNEPARVRLELQDVLHTFAKGHRVMIQVSCTWFPLVDRNPQKYVPNIFKASDDDFTPATQKVFRSRELPSLLQVGVLPASRN